ncbi:hypothetical protein PMAYCL1PPCAC_24936, partial [Pristionchus mayeri]
SLLDRAEYFLIFSSDAEISWKLLLSDDFGLVKLQEDCLDQLETMESVKALKDTPEYKQLSNATKGVLLEKMFRLMP